MSVSMRHSRWIAALALLVACGDDGPTEPPADPTVTVTIVGQRPGFHPPFSATRESGELDLRGTFAAPCAGVELTGEAWHEDDTLHVHIIAQTPEVCEGGSVQVPYDAVVTSAGGSGALSVQHSVAGSTEDADVVFSAVFN